MASHKLEAIDVVVVVFNPGPELEELAASLSSATHLTVRLVLVNNGERNDTIDRVVAATGATVVDPGSNVGYGAGVNLGVDATQGPWIVAANPDIVMSPGSLDRLLETARRHDEAGVLGPCLLNQDGSVYPSARAVPRIGQGAAHALLGPLWPSNPWSVAYRKENTAGQGEPRATGWLSGAFLLLRRAAFDEVGGFDESFFMFFEDLDLGERLAAAGWVSLYVPTVQIVHVQGASWKQKPARMISAHHASAMIYVNKKYGRWYQAPLRLTLRVGLWARERLQLLAAARH